MAEERTIVEGLNQFLRDRDRRAFLKLVGLGTAVAAVPVVLAGCEDPVDKTKEDDIKLGSQFAGLNLMYALLQLNADFMARIIANKYVGMTANENTWYSQLNSLWTTHRNFLQSGITSGRVTDAILFDFSTVDFSSRSSVNTLLLQLTDLLTAASNGVVSTLKTSSHIIALGKMHSVWGRATAALRDELAITAAANASSTTRGTAFAATVTSGLDATKTPAEVYTATDTYFRTTLNITGA